MSIFSASIEAEATSVTLDRRMTVLPVALLAVLNLADVVLTRVALAHGAVEANPLSRALLDSGRVELAKVAVLCLLALRMARRRPSLRLAAACWIALGAYLMVVLSNVYVVWSVH
jgi:hypothetical protein